MASVKPDNWIIKRDNEYTRKNHRGRKLWAEPILNGELPPRASYRCSSCISHVVDVPVLPVSTMAVGVDYITVRVPLIEETGLMDEDMFFSELRRHESGAHEGKYEHSSGVTVHCKLDMPNAMLKVSFNPSRVLDPTGYLVCPADMVPDVTKAVLLELFTEVSGLRPVFAHSEDRGEVFMGDFDAGWESEVWLIRVDVTRDFQVTQPWFNIDLLRHKKVRHSKGTVLYQGKGDSETWEAVTGKKTGKTKFYNKTVERTKRRKKRTDPAPDPGFFRFEHSLKNAQLKEAHLHSLADINRATVEAAIWFYWEKSTLGTDINPRYGWMEYFIGNPDLGDADIVAAIAYYAAKEAGQQLPISDAERRRITAIATRAGLSHRTQLSKQSPSKYRLDLETGSLITSSQVPLLPKHS